VLEEARIQSSSLNTVSKHHGTSSSSEAIYKCATYCHKVCQGTSSANGVVTIQGMSLRSQHIIKKESSSNLDMERAHQTVALHKDSPPVPPPPFSLQKKWTDSLYVGKLSADDGDRGAANGAAEQPEDEESRPVRRQGATERPEGKQDMSRYGQVSTSDMLTERAPYVIFRK
jgi:hypothetical protein